MGGFDFDRQDSTQPYPVSSTAAAAAPVSSSLQASSHGINIGFNQGQPPQPNDGMNQQNYPLMDHGSGRPSGSMVFDGNPTAAGYHFGPSPTSNDGNDGPSSAMMFANSAGSQLQHPQQASHMYDSAAERFQLQQHGYVPSTFTAGLDPMAAFGNYGAPQNYQNPHMGMPLTYGGPTPPPQHPMNMMFTTATYEPTLQPSMQAPVAAAPNQENWSAMSSNFNLPMTGQNLQVEVDHLSASSQNISPDVHSGSFITSELPARPNNSPSVQNPFIPSGKSSP